MQAFRSQVEMFYGHTILRDLLYFIFNLFNFDQVK